MVISKFCFWNLDSHYHTVCLQVSLIDNFYFKMQCNRRKQNLVQSELSYVMGGYGNNYYD